MGGESGRLDRVVVLARGRGTRMGEPKFGLRLPGDDRTFLARILDLYREADRPVVVTFPGGKQACLESAMGRAVTVIEGPGSGDTALTLLTAWRQSGSGAGVPTHWWAHPVDLPLVASFSLVELAAASADHPGLVIRPQFKGRVGHPVVIPTGVIADLETKKDWHEGPLRHFLEDMVRSGRQDPVLTVNVSDEGVVQDFDQPADLEAWRPGDGGHDEQP